MSISNPTGRSSNLGPGTGAITSALIEHGVDQKRLVLVEYNPGFCALLRDRYPHAKVVQGDAYTLRDSLWNVLSAPASAVVSGLPLVTKPMLTRLKLIRDAFVALAPGAPFVQFTYSVAPPIPKSLPGVSTEASERIWMNLPPARVWVYRKGLIPSRAALRGGFVLNAILDHVRAENPRDPRLAAHRLAQCEACGGGRVSIRAGRRRSHPHFARRFSAADL